MMKRIISASRRTDLVAHAPEWMAKCLQTEKANVYGPSGRTYTADLRPAAVHTLVVWSKNFTNLIDNHLNLRNLLQKYEQVYFHFTITGLGGTFIERGVPAPSQAVCQLAPLSEIAGIPERISVRFDPVVYWKDNSKIKTNLEFFRKLAVSIRSAGIKDIRFSFTQWYSKAVKRSEKHFFEYFDPPLEQKIHDTRLLQAAAEENGLILHACSQKFLANLPGIRVSSCIDGQRLMELHPSGETASTQKDKTQRSECCCTKSVDIGSYAQSCPNACLYCYANPKV